MMRNRVSYLVMLIALCSLTFAQAQSVQAADKYWRSLSGNWSSGNWNGGEPTSNDIAYIINGGTVTIDQAGEQAGFVALGGNSVINQTGGSLEANSLGQYGGPFTYNISDGLLTVGYLRYAGAINQTGGRISEILQEAVDENS